MRERDLYIGDSKIQGKGLFTKKSIKKGQLAFILRGKKKRKINKTTKDVFDNPDWVGFNESWWTDPRIPFRFLNHSCNPNVGFKGSVSFFALRDIKPNEELTFDYSISEAEKRWYLKCSCGQRECRKRITSIQYLPYRVYEHYLPYIPTGMKKVYNKFNNEKGK